MKKNVKDGLNTPYDSAFKSIIRKCPRMALYLINEMFYKNGLIEEHYSGRERVVFLDKELPSLHRNSSVMDQRFTVYTDTSAHTFHLECESGKNGTIILRMIQYDTASALEQADYTVSRIRIKIDDSGILFLRSGRNTPGTMKVILEVPQNRSVSYRIPVIKMQDYSFDDIIEKKLFLLLPFIFFNYENQLKKISENKDGKRNIQSIYKAIINKLKNPTEADDDGITAYEASILYEAMQVVFDALAEKHEVKKEVAEIMGGEILVFSADKYFDAGKAEGIVEGKAKGIAEGEEMLGKLITMLITDGRSDEVAKAASDKEYRTLLYKDYAIS